VTKLRTSLRSISRVFVGFIRGLLKFIEGFEKDSLRA